MPIIEEKLISPFAINFSQARIRSTFRDGQDVEATCTEIERKPGYGGYDLVLSAPFPAIEVTRWTPGSRADRKASENWFTYDNRRLYCLQKAAAAHWPLHVGVVVEVSAHAQHSSSVMLRKLDTDSGGQSVVMALSCRARNVAPVLEFNWREAILNSASRAQASAICATTTEEMERASFDRVAADQRKTTVDLFDVAVSPTSLLAMARGDSKIDEKFNMQATQPERQAKSSETVKRSGKHRNGRCGNSAKHESSSDCLRWVPVSSA